MYLNIRKEEVHKLPMNIRDRGERLFPTVNLSNNIFNGDKWYEQSWKFDHKGNYTRVPREPKWKYKIYLCGSYRIDGKPRNKQLLLTTLYYWDIVDHRINDNEEHMILQTKYDGSSEYVENKYHWINTIYVFDDIPDEMFIQIRDTLKSQYGEFESVHALLYGLIADALKNEIEAIGEDFKTTEEYTIKNENIVLIKKCEEEAKWLNEQNGFVVNKK